MGFDAVSLRNLEETMRGDDLAGEFDGVWRENVKTVEAFLTVCGQWRVVPRGGGGTIAPMAGGIILPIVPLFIGLDYASVRVGLDAEGFEVTPLLWRGLRAMEQAAVKGLNEDA
ncbi:DUF1799 domain-containing protein [Bradyrhizobium sp. LA6.7]|uniref:DUF1799 domain-containing protein n=1 Tax=unclassified Bradyrhizobium TaxID=2631580 RepID=UPI003396A608